MPFAQRAAGTRCTTQAVPWRIMGGVYRGPVLLRIAAGVALAALCTSCTPSAPWSVALPDPTVRPASSIDAISSYERAAVTVASIFEQDLEFPSFPVTLHFFPGRGPFEAALLESGYDADLARDTAGSMAAIGGHRQVLLNESTLVALTWPARVGMLAHELTHSLQYEWGGGVRGASDQWLREGFAEWVTARVLERLGAITLEQVRRQKRDDFRRVDRARVPRLEVMATFPEWVAINQELNAAPYAYAFLAADFLVERYGLPAVIRYFELFARSGDRARNFRAAFGENVSSFEDALLEHLLTRR